jgi:hypothetical protein
MIAAAAHAADTLVALAVLALSVAALAFLYQNRP